jgi:uncharacterized protein
MISLFPSSLVGMTTFAVQFLFDRDEDARLAVRPRHREYLRELTASGRLRLAGPFADGDGALLVYDVADRDELEAILARDPYFAGGDPVASIHSIRAWELLDLS